MRLVTGLHRGVRALRGDCEEVVVMVLLWNCGGRFAVRGVVDASRLGACDVDVDGCDSIGLESVVVQ